MTPEAHTVSAGTILERWFHAQQYSVVQKEFPPVWNCRLISAKQNGQPMHSQLALTEHVSLNLAPLILLDPVFAAIA